MKDKTTEVSTRRPGCWENAAPNSERRNGVRTSFSNRCGNTENSADGQTKPIRRQSETMIFKRDKTYYYEFELRGRRYRESTRQGNPRVARQMEAARRTQIL